MRNISATERAQCRWAKMCKPSSTALTAMVAVAALVALGGCVTPIEVKQASKAQLELLTALDAAADELQQSLGQFHRSIEARTREEGRIWVAKQAIEVAYPDSSDVTVTADALFKGHKESIQPWIDYAFLSDDIDATIARIKERMKKTTDPALKIQLDNEEQTWQRRKIALAKKPSAVKQIEAVIVDDLNGEMKTAAEIHNVLDILRAQIAVMKQMAGRIDAWLAIDVTVTQEQADGLRQAFSAAAGSLGGAK
jgi:hypothetical protein